MTPPADAPLRPLAKGARADVLAALRASVAQRADAWVQRSVEAKGWRDVRGAFAEEWASGPLPVARFLAHLNSGESARGADQIPWRIPGLGDRLLLRGYRVRVHVAPGGAAAQHDGAGSSALVLGAGNVTATPLLDVLDQVFCRARAVVLKLSPLHRDLRDLFEQALAPLVARNVVRIVSGDAAAGRSLAQLADVDAVHVTGSAATWAALRADPALRGKALSAEVGCCTPALVLPGMWRERELRHAAAQLAGFVAANGGATCIAPRVLLTAASWPQRPALREHLRLAFAALPARVPFHPGVRDHHAVASGTPAPAGALRPVLTAERDLRTEAELSGYELFAPVLREVALPGDDVAAFLRHATAFARERCFGSLSAYVLGPPHVLAPARAVVDAAIEALPHGTIAINTWTGVGYGLGSTPWGVRPAAPIEHGSGWTRNTTGRDVERVVIEAPFRPHPLPPWSTSHRAARAMLRALTMHTLQPWLLRLAGVAARALASP
ncbi:MAG TPA: aldehyde dehydrogenase family protein [Planctomycetota bacterium]|nr:aldehyde dehydrogenase family protein [Planctomycetota bacterium]